MHRTSGERPCIQGLSYLHTYLRDSLILSFEIEMINRPRPTLSLHEEEREYEYNTYRISGAL